MNVLRGIVKWIDAFESGSHFKKWTAMLLKAVGILAIIVSVVWGIAVYVGSIFASDNLDTNELIFSIIGSLLTLCLNIFLGIVLILLFWNRSKKIRELHEEISFEILQIAVILTRLVGEAVFILFVVSGIQGLVASIFGTGFLDILGFVLIEIEYEINGQSTFIQGILTFIQGILTFLSSTITGASVLIVHYCLAALINLFVDIATNVRSIDRTPATDENSSDSIEETISAEEHNSDS